jgi:hypothetical protein
MPRRPLTISKRAKGFPVNLTKQHWFVIQQMYPWLESIGATDEQTDEAFALIPKWPITQADIDSAGSTAARPFGSGRST